MGQGDRFQEEAAASHEQVKAANPTGVPWEMGSNMQPLNQLREGSYIPKSARYVYPDIRNLGTAFRGGHSGSPRCITPQLQPNGNGDTLNLQVK